MQDALGALGAVIGAGLFALIGIFIGQRMESKRGVEHWKRDQILDASARFIALSGRRYESRRSGSSPVEAQTEVDEAYARARLTILGDGDVWEALEKLAKRVSAASPSSTDEDHQKTIAALRILNGSVRRQIGLDQRDSSSLEAGNNSGAK